jgi:thiamine-phosphate pyrophosphorylase
MWKNACAWGHEMRERSLEGLMLVTDRALCQPRSLEDVVMQAVRGGAAWVQLREKHLSTHAFIEQALRLKERLALAGVPLLINDRVDVALAVGADGVHLGQDDMPIPLARRLLGQEAIIGLSVERWEDVEKAQHLEVDYLGASPVFATPTKVDTKGAWGLQGLARIKAYSRHSLVAIGGLNATNIADAVRAGADGIAVVSAICSVPEPQQAALDLSQRMRAARSRPSAGPSSSA